MPAMALRSIAPRPVPNSALVTKLSAFAALDEDEVAALENCERTTRRVARRRVVRRQGEDATCLYVLRAGWAFDFSIMPDGGRQVLDLHFPGDIVGLSSIAVDASANGIATTTHVELCPFSRAAFAEVTSASPRLTGLLGALAMVENVILVDRLKSMGRMEARDRVAHFFLQVHARLRIADPGLGDSFTLPMSQELIGDTLGLSSIHINRTLRRLEDEGLLQRDHQRITLPDRARLAESVDFINRYDQLTTAWLTGQGDPHAARHPQG